MLYYNGQQQIRYDIPNVPAGDNYKVRLHFSQNYFSNYGDEIFNISINGNVVSYGFDILAHTGGQMYTAYIAEFNNISPVNGVITVALDGQSGNYGWCNASICGIEVVKP